MSLPLQDRSECVAQPFVAQALLPVRFVVAQPAAPEMSRLRYTHSVPMTATTIDLLWTGRPRSIAAVLLESDGHRAILDPGHAGVRSYTSVFSHHFCSARAVRTVSF